MLYKIFMCLILVASGWLLATVPNMEKKIDSITCNINGNTIEAKAKDDVDISYVVENGVIVVTNSSIGQIVAPFWGAAMCHVVYAND